MQVKPYRYKISQLHTFKNKNESQKKTRCENFHVPGNDVRYLICDTRPRRKCHAYDTSKAVRFQRNKIKIRYLERAHIEGRSDVIGRQIGNNINILLSFCCLTFKGCQNSPLHSPCALPRRRFQREAYIPGGHSLIYAFQSY